MVQRVIVVRHGETAWNAQGRIQHLDTPLNEEGLAQAILVERRARADRCHCSDLGACCRRCSRWPIAPACADPERAPARASSASSSPQRRVPDAASRRLCSLPRRDVDRGARRRSIRRVYVRVSQFDEKARAHAGAAWWSPMAASSMPCTDIVTAAAGKDRDRLQRQPQLDALGE